MAQAFMHAAAVGVACIAVGLKGWGAGATEPRGTQWLNGQAQRCQGAEQLQPPKARMQIA